MKGNKSLATTIVVIVVLLIVVGAVFALTGNKKKDTSGTSSTNMNNSQSNSSNSESTNTTTPVATNSVDIKDMAFTPADITVKVGTTVTWTNQDAIGHTVTSDDGDSLSPKLDSKTLAKGDTYTYTFNTAGTFKYHCAVHPNMTGTVTVTQ